MKSYPYGGAPTESFSVDEMNGCDLCRTHVYPRGGPWCARCRPEEFAAEVERVRQILAGGGSVAHFDEVNRRRYAIRLGGTR